MCMTPEAMALNRQTKVDAAVRLVWSAWWNKDHENRPKGYKEIDQIRVLASHYRADGPASYTAELFMRQVQQEWRRNYGRMLASDLSYVRDEPRS